MPEPITGSIVTPEWIAAVRTNYGLDTRTPLEAGAVWAAHGVVAGAVIALGHALNRIEELQRLPLATPEMMADKERFDWLADQGQNWHEPKYNDRGNYCGHGGFSRRIWSVESDSQTASLREAIDAARAAGGAHGA